METPLTWLSMSFGVLGHQDPPLRSRGKGDVPMSSAVSDYPCLKAWHILNNAPTLPYSNPGSLPPANSE